MMKIGKITLEQILQSIIRYFGIKNGIRRSKENPHGLTRLKLQDIEALQCIIHTIHIIHLAR